MAIVYAHICPNNKIYIGVTTSTKAEYRWEKNGKGYCNQQLFWRAIQKYGWDNIKHIVLLNNISIEVACECEKYLIAKYQSNNIEYGYNLAIGGEVNCGYHHTDTYKAKLSSTLKALYKNQEHPSKGRKLSDDTKQKISQTLTDRKQSQATKDKRNAKLKGHIVTEETRQKISEKNKGRKLTDEQRQKMSEFRKGKAPICAGWCKGKKLSDKTRQKMSESHKGQHKSEEHKKKLSEAMKGRKKGPMSEEHKQKIREAHLKRRGV